MATLAELREKLEQGETLLVSPDDTNDYEAIYKNKWGKYVYVYGLEDPETFPTFEEFEEHLNEIGRGENEDELYDGWEVDSPNISQLVHRETWEKAKEMVLVGNTYGVEAAILKMHLATTQQRIERYNHALDDRLEKALIARLEEIYALPWDESMVSIPEWRKQYMRMKELGLELQAEYLATNEMLKVFRETSYRCSNLIIDVLKREDDLPPLPEGYTLPLTLPHDHDGITS